MHAHALTRTNSHALNGIEYERFNEELQEAKTRINFYFKKANTVF